MRSVAGVAVERPLAFGGALELMARLASPLVQLVTVVPDSPNGPTARWSRHPSDGQEGGDAAALGDAGGLRAATRRHAASVATIVTSGRPGSSPQRGSSCSRGARRSSAADTAYRCRSFVCALPVHEAGALEALVDRA